MRQESLRRLVSLGLLILLLVVFGLTSESFFTLGNITNLLRESAIIGILAVGITLVIITGGNDLSCGALLGLVCMFIGYCLHYTQMSPAVILLMSLGIALLGGLFNGFLVAVLHIPDFIATLSSKFVFTGLMYVFAIRNEVGLITTERITLPIFKLIGGKGAFGIYYISIVFLIMVLLAQFLLKNTRVGTRIYAVGANKTAAEFSGISVVKTKITAFLLSSLCVFVAAMCYLGKTRAVDTGSGLGMEFRAISATVIGGTAFSGGRGDALGTLIGVLFMQTLQNGVLKFGFPTEMQQIITGVVIVVMLVFDAFYNRYMTEHSKKSVVVAREMMAVMK